jgi:hypothetical protein
VIEASGVHLSCPTRGAVAGLATRHEATFVWVRMTCGALIERKSQIFDVRLRVRDGPMAFVAGDFDMCAREGEF